MYCISQPKVKWESRKNWHLQIIPISNKKTKYNYTVGRNICSNIFLVEASFVSNFEPLDVRSFPLGKVCVRARSKFENVIFCSNQSQILGNTRRTFNVYLMKMFEYVRISNAWWCLCSKILENRRSYSLEARIRYSDIPAEH